MDEEDDIDFMMRVLNVDQSAFRALARSGTNTIMPGEIRLERGTETDDETGVITPKFKSNGDPYYCLRFRRANEEYFARFPDGTAGCRKILDLLEQSYEIIAAVLAMSDRRPDQWLCSLGNSMLAN